MNNKIHVEAMPCAAVNEIVESSSNYIFYIEVLPMSNVSLHASRPAI
jgi:hypothetical protein